jgi:hypothetical protein
VRDSVLPELRRRVRARRGYEVLDSGNFGSQDSADRLHALCVLSTFSAFDGLAPRPSRR